MYQCLHNDSNRCFLNSAPIARADIKGGADNHNISGYAELFPYRNGTVMIIELWGLPYSTEPCADNILAIHIHEGESCSQNEGMFSAVGGHFNPKSCPHPAHAGDLPPLFSAHGYAWLGFFTDRFTPGEVSGKTIIIHSKRDDFTTQPAGDSGDRIACGIITPLL